MDFFAFAVLHAKILGPDNVSSVFFLPSFIHSFGWLVGSFVRSFLPSFIRSFTIHFDRSCVRSFVRSFRAFLPSFLTPFLPPSLPLPSTPLYDHSQFRTTSRDQTSTSFVVPVPRFLHVLDYLLGVSLALCLVCVVFVASWPWLASVDDDHLAMMVTIADADTKDDTHLSPFFQSAQQGLLDLVLPAVPTPFWLPADVFVCRLFSGFFCCCGRCRWVTSRVRRATVSCALRNFYCRIRCTFILRQ